MQVVITYLMTLLTGVSIQTHEAVDCRISLYQTEEQRIEIVFCQEPRYFCDNQITAGWH